jgi:hypothetical protein
LDKITTARLWAYHRDQYYLRCYVLSSTAIWKNGSSSLAKILKACGGSLKIYLRWFIDAHHTAQALFRLIDDYLFITTSLPKARDFLDMMNRGK